MLRFLIIFFIALGLTFFVTSNLYNRYGLSTYFPISLNKKEVTNLKVDFVYYAEGGRNGGLKPGELVPTININNTVVRISCLGVEILCDAKKQFPAFYIEKMSYFPLDKKHILVDSISYHLLSNPKDLQVLRNNYNGIDPLGILHEFKETISFYRWMSWSIFICIIFVCYLFNWLDNRKNRE
jgi:hypothetical protein